MIILSESVHNLLNPDFQLGSQHGDPGHSKTLIMTIVPCIIPELS